MADVKICDRCRGIFPLRKSWFDIKAERHIFRFISRRIDDFDCCEYEYIDRQVDLCMKCRDDLERFLRGQAVDAVKEE